MLRWWPVADPREEWASLDGWPRGFSDHELLGDIPWLPYQGVPIRPVTELPEVRWSRWDVSWSRDVIYRSGDRRLRARWGRFRSRWRRRWSQARDAWAVLQGRMEAVEWDEL